MSGFVYFIRCADRVKIGYSDDPARRLTKVNADAPFPCDLLGYVPAADFPERELHEKFAALRVHSEWFLASADLLQFISAASVAAPIIGDRFERADLSAASPLLRWRYSQKARQQDVAASLGINQATWNRWENGRARIPADRLADVVGLTGIPAADLRPDLHLIFGAVA